MKPRGFVVLLAFAQLAACNKTSPTETCDPIPSAEQTFDLVWPNSPTSSLTKVVVNQAPAPNGCGGGAMMSVQVIHQTVGAVSFDLELSLVSDSPWSMLAKIPRIGPNDTLTFTLPFDKDFTTGTLTATVSRVYGLVPII